MYVIIKYMEYQPLDEQTLKRLDEQKRETPEEEDERKKREALQRAQLLTNPADQKRKDEEAVRNQHR